MNEIRIQSILIRQQRGGIPIFISGDDQSASSVRLVATISYSVPGLKEEVSVFLPIQDHTKSLDKIIQEAQSILSDHLRKIYRNAEGQDLEWSTYIPPTT